MFSCCSDQRPLSQTRFNMSSVRRPALEVSQRSKLQIKQPVRDAENAAEVLSADHSSACTDTAPALTPHLLSSAFLSEQLKALLHFLQVVKLRIDVRSPRRDSRLSADLHFYYRFHYL